VGPHIIDDRRGRARCGRLVCDFRRGPRREFACYLRARLGACATSELACCPHCRIAVMQSWTLADSILIGPKNMPDKEPCLDL
jgi:hypothetical protein